MEKSYKFRIYPNGEQVAQIQRTFGCCRFSFNHLLSKRIEAYRESGKTLNYFALCRELTELKIEYPWLRNVDSSALQSTAQDLDIAYRHFFRRIKSGGKVGFPKFKSKKNSNKSYRAKQCKGATIVAFEKHIKLPKLGKVKTAISKQIQGRILNATVSQTPSGKYFVSLCCTGVDIPQYQSSGKTVGLDMGLKELVTTSDGTTYPNYRHISKSENKLAKLQRQLSRKTIGSANRNKARLKVARMQEYIANQRKDALHKLTTELVKEYDVICVEDLAVKNMVKNHKLAKSISDASWGELHRQLKYKCEWQHKSFVKIDRFFASSQVCGGCGLQNPKVKALSVREWTCGECGVSHDRDINAAKNILSEGLRLLSA